MREFVGEHYLPSEAGQGAVRYAKAARGAADRLTEAVSDTGAAA
jgi:hypothetical protein